MMKLSEAMRLGATLKPQAFGSFSKVEHFSCGDVIRTCALGASLDAIGRLSLVGRVAPDGNLYPTEWYALLKGHVVCPEKDSCSWKRTGTVAEIIAHLNDNPSHNWTREQIADWVETVEAQIAAPVEEMAVAQV